MDRNESIDLEDLIFSYIDEFRVLFFPNQWMNMLLDYSKNEVLVLLYLHRCKTANMTQISEYINSPLNTATGVINRLEKKSMVERVRSSEDRRVVQITLTDKAKEFISEEIQVIENYFKKVYDALTQDEKTTAIQIFRKIINVLVYSKNQADEKEVPTKKIKKIIIE